MTIALYSIWALIPLLLFLMALWSYLEKTAGKKKQERPGDLFRQAIFTTVCCLASIALDQYCLPIVLTDIFTEYLPYGVYQVILYPAVLFVGAKIIGPSKAIMISKAPEASAKYKR